MAHWLPLHHDMGLIGGFFAALFGGIDAVILPPALFLRRPAAWLRAVSRYRASFTAAPNFGYGFAADRVRDDQLEGVDLSSWRFLFCGAEPIHPPTLQRFLDRFAPWGLRPDCIAPSYGLAEGTLAVTIARPRARLAFDTVHREALAVDGKAVDVDAGDRMAVEVTDCGPPVEGAEVRVVDRAGTPLGPSLLGRVQFRGPATTPGYFRDPDATRAVIDTDGWFDTGDLGYLRDGRLRIAGREKDVIVIRGANYFPADFERAAATMKEVRAGGVAAIGRYDPVTSTEGLYLVVETTLTDASEGDELRLRIRGAVSAHTGIAPTAVFLVPRRSIPTTSSGKIQHEEAARLFVDPHLENGDP
jgi:acyl-CoA synthetase (AMP-forming)/AMP-acid ligase II